MEMKCKNCGAVLGENARFCTECGAKVEPLVETAPVEPVTAEVPAAQDAPASPETGSYTAPEAGNYTAPEAGSYTAPEAGSYTAPEAGSYTAPQQGGYTAPQQGGYTAPQQGGYTAPQQGGYVPPAGGYVPPRKPGKGGKKKGGMSAGVIVLIVLSALILLAVAILGIVLAGGRGGAEADEASLGLYQGISYTVGDVELPAEDDWIELNAKGKGEFSLMGQEASFKWETDGYELIIKDGGDEINGSLKDGVIKLEYGGVTFTFAKEGFEPEVSQEDEVQDAEPEEEGEFGWEDFEEEPVEEETASAMGNYADWAGDYYGWWVLWDSTGDLEPLNGAYWDVCATIETTEDDLGFIQIWDEEGDNISAAEVYFEDGITDSGRMVSEYGAFMGFDVAEDDWVVDPGDEKISMIDNMICIEGTIVDESHGDATATYYIFLRPWGLDWEDVKDANPEETIFDNMMPGYYEQWYLPLIQDGKPMPETPFEGIELE